MMRYKDRPRLRQCAWKYLPPFQILNVSNALAMQWLTKCLSILHSNSTKLRRMDLNYAKCKQRPKINLTKDQTWCHMCKPSPKTCVQQVASGLVTCPTAQSFSTCVSGQCQIENRVYMNNKRFYDNRLLCPFRGEVKTVPDIDLISFLIFTFRKVVH